MFYFPYIKRCREKYVYYKSSTHTHTILVTNRYVNILCRFNPHIILRIILCRRHYELIIITVRENKKKTKNQNPSKLSIHLRVR